MVDCRGNRGNENQMVVNLPANDYLGACSSDAIPFPLLTYVVFITSKMFA